MSTLIRRRLLNNQKTDLLDLNSFSTNIYKYATPEWVRAAGVNIYPQPNMQTISFGASLSTYHSVPTAVQLTAYRQIDVTNYTLLRILVGGSHGPFSQGASIAYVFLLDDIPSNIVVNTSTPGFLTTLACNSGGVSPYVNNKKINISQYSGNKYLCFVVQQAVAGTGEFEGIHTDLSFGELYMQ